MIYDLKYDEFFSYKGLQIGAMHGGARLLVIKTGAGGSIYGYQGKYYRLSESICIKHDYSVLVVDCPLGLDDDENMSATMEVAQRYVVHIQAEKVVYLGFSKGALLGACYAWQYPILQQLMLVNMPLMINWHRSRTGLQQFNGKGCIAIFGEGDPSFSYREILHTIQDKEIMVWSLSAQGHHIDLQGDFLKMLDRMMSGY